MKYSELSVDFSFFAAANSYNGFKSLFDKVFNPHDFLKIIILKGGPGTGKSTLIKNALRHASGCEYYTEAIYCSSDPNSLDGAIIKSSKGAIAILDGTAPHSRDPIFPGAVEEIVNLGDGFNADALEAARDEIMSISKRKSESYSNAYAYLGAAGSIHDCIRDVISKYSIYSEAEIASCALSEMSECSYSACERTVYASAFCKDGYRSLSLPFTDKKVVEVNGNRGCVMTTMRALHNLLRAKKCIEITCPSPLDIRDIEVITTKDCVYKAAPDNENEESKKLLETSPELQRLISAHKIMLESARSAFASASSAHFALEKIYTESMNFSFNERALSLICELLDKKL